MPLLVLHFISNLFYEERLKKEQEIKEKAEKERKEKEKNEKDAFKKAMKNEKKSLKNTCKTNDYFSTNEDDKVQNLTEFGVRF